jgi:hypothetical protein
MRTRMLLTGALLIAAATGFVACGDDPKTHLPTGPELPHAAFVQIIGPSSIAPGTTAQFLAQVQQSDNTTKFATTPIARWTSSNPVVLSVNASGLATAGAQRGEAIVTAEVTPGGTETRRRSMREIVVVPDGTFRVVGVLTDANLPAIPIPGARVEVPGTGLVTTSDDNGQYRLYGVPPDADIQVTADGYESRTQSVHLSGHLALNLQLTFNGPPGSLSGNYTLAIDADSCGGTSSLAPELRHRTYDAVLTQTGIALDVVLTEPRFRLNGANKGNRFLGRIVSGGARFTLDYYDYYYTTQYPSVAERLSPDNSILVPQGTVTVVGGASGMTGSMLSGSSMTRWSFGFPNGSFHSGCFSVMRFSLTPR